jgi:glycogen debranching enzyme
MPTFGTAADDEVVSLHEQHYIQATSSRADDRTRVLKHDETFAVFDRFGDIQPVGLGEQGIYHEGTRFLSRLELRLGGRRPLLLSSTVKKENDLLTVDLATPDLKDQTGQLVLPRGTLHLFRTKFLWRSCCYERLRVSNYATTAVDIELAISFNADYADIFEVRGSKRERHGVRHDPVVDGSSVVLSYEGLDRVTRRTRLAFDPAPDELTGSHARFHLRLPPRGPRRCT